MPENMPPTEDEPLVANRDLRWNRFLKRTGSALGGLIAVIFLTGGVSLLRSSRALETRIQAIHDAGEPVSLADLVGPRIPAEENAALYYRRAQGDLRAMARDLQAVQESGRWLDGPLTRKELQTIQQAMARIPQCDATYPQGGQLPGDSLRRERGSRFRIFGSRRPGGTTG